MNDNQLLKRTLMARKQELEERLKGMSVEKLTDDDVQDVGDMAAANTSEGISLSMQQTTYQEYEAVCKALEAMQRGDYGICVDCGATISPKRLAVNPNATRCVVCQEKLESHL